MKRTILVTTCALTGCLAQAAPPQPAAAPLVSVAPLGNSAVPTPMVLPGTYTPSPLTDPSQAAFNLAVTPSVPCPGQEMVIEGHQFRDVHRVSAWLGATQAFRASTSPPPGQLAGAVKVGEAQVDATGSFRITFTLKERLGPVSTGGELVLQPGEFLSLGLAENGHLVGPGYGFQVGSLTCTSFSPAPFEAHLEPAAPCNGPAHVVGSGFTGPVAKLQFARLETRFNMGPRVDKEAPVGPDGRVDYAFDPATFLDDTGHPLFGPGKRYSVTLFDPATQRTAGVTIPYCNGALAEALAATGITPVAAMTGKLDRASSLPPAPQEEALTLRSRAELDAWTASHQLDAHIAARLPAVDFDRDEVLVIGQEPGGTANPAAQLEITAVEDAGAGYKVHAVRWISESPIFPSFVFDFVVVPRKDGPTTFLPSAEGFYEDWVGTRKQQQRLDVSPDNTPQITT
jgi:hypothetical protein